MTTKALLNADQHDPVSDLQNDQQAGEFVKSLEQSGFFQQISSLENNLSHIASDLSSIGERATERVEEVETLAAHVVALEAVLAVMLKTHPVAAADVQAEVKKRTEILSGNPEGSPTVQAVAAELVASGA